METAHLVSVVHVFLIRGNELLLLKLFRYRTLVR